MTTEKINARSNARRIFIITRSPAKKAPIPACAAATLLYAIRIIKPRPQAVNRLRTRRLIATIDRDETAGCGGINRGTRGAARR